MPSKTEPNRSWPLYGERQNPGAYKQPYSGVGMKFEPLGAPNVDTEIVLHKVGYWPKNYGWNYQSVYTPFWRLDYDFDKGQAGRFGKSITQLTPNSLVMIPNDQRFDCMGDLLNGSEEHGSIWQ